MPSIFSIDQGRTQMTWSLLTGVLSYLTLKFRVLWYSVFYTSMYQGHPALLGHVSISTQGARDFGRSTR